MSEAGSAAANSPFMEHRPLLRQKGYRTRLVDITVAGVLPWLLFFLDVCLFLFVFHDSSNMAWALIAACSGVAFLFLILGCCMRHTTFLAIGVLCIISVAAGTSLGFWLNSHYLDRYWALDGGHEFKDVDPGGDPRKTLSATVLRFASGSFVDDRSTVGFLADGGLFCVAPVVAASKPDDPRSYWAVGEDCCQTRSNFDCGLARDLELGRFAIVDAHHSKHFEEAVNQAATVYGLQVPAGAQLVRFVGDPKVFMGDIWEEALTISLVAMVMDLGLCFLSGISVAVCLLRG